ncbi:LuxR C-terminal-related transcriptional regulator [Moellerella wisconsensis]|uniref:LuxR C-terminal-related transcriptional regulator n=2 Tax=Moellerella wisconsensis TaxID=158849 RepID=A0A9Q8Q3V8_9GAMM|nr:LuxR C-terminal-related transcriptional regulator [Moellerella wisconsensis]KLN95765.1 histidine kinase [Moellerella wisconsensis]UNH25305.1 LuxR C-terminal-related transcriptional regulator [Moellerella wisconsensis]UNH28489.1 LuxR C-terminal-related transcriptional regulator [Moellerella wisconsensis]UNH31945.1 LuxR C-terminal-related transcriptional regulator [Moellerella wisconsensis]UNH40055.1 LuxR C-terminal-related transcriptional regulator [Moellerella wisconsensis]
MINILIIEDNNIILHGLQSIFTKSSRLKALEAVPMVSQAIIWCRHHNTDVILMNANQCHFISLDKIQTLMRLQPDAVILLHSAHDNYACLLKSLEIGVHGILSIGATVDDIIDAVKVVNTRQKFLSPDIAQKLALHRASYAEQCDLYAILSRREMEIMHLIAGGAAVAVIAERLQISPKTVNSYRYRMFSKLNIRSDVELTHIAISYGLIAIERVYQSGGSI